MDDAAPTPSETLDDIRHEGLRLAEAAQTDGIALRLMGGVAVWATCPSAGHGPLARTYGDIDFISRSKLRSQIVSFFERHGYEPDRRFNALHGASRLIFADPARERPIDVILDRFAMCHVIELRDRLDGFGLTLPLADLLLTKLQIVEINQKDIRDAVTLLLDHPLGGAPAKGGPGEDGEPIDIARITRLTSDDWGLDHTVRLTLERLRTDLPDLGLDPASVERVSGRIAGLLAAAETGPKTLRWKVRSRLGERVRWYELPEEVRR